jgi:hypothetical protein
MDRGKHSASGDLPQPSSWHRRRYVLSVGWRRSSCSGLFVFLIIFASFLCAQGLWGRNGLGCRAPAHWCGPCSWCIPGGGPLPDMQVAEMGNCLEEALRDHHRHVEALKDARAALDAIEAEAEAARVAADGVEAHRVGRFLGRFMFRSFLGRVPLIVAALQTWKTGCWSFDGRWGSCGAKNSTRRRVSTFSPLRRRRLSTLWLFLQPCWWTTFEHYLTVLGVGACRGAPRGVGSFGRGCRAVGRTMALLRSTGMARGL